MSLQNYLLQNEDNILHRLNNINIDDFSKLDENDILYLLVSASGFNGHNIRNVAIGLLKDYDIWLKLNKNNVSIVSSKKIKKYIDFLQNNKCTYSKDLTNLITYIDKLYML